MLTGVPPVQTLVLFAVLALAIALLVLVARTTRRPRVEPVVAPASPDGSAPDAPPPLPAVVANPTKIGDVDGERAWLSRRCTELGWSRPLWFETRLDEPGAQAAQDAVARGASSVLAYGGDGTVRAVASGLEGTGVSLGILPMGTGNLLARNLGLPLSDAEEAVTVALTGVERRIDLGLLEVDRTGADAEPERHVFLVMAGLGFDADVMANVEPALKEKVGWFAYVVAGARQLRGQRTTVTIVLDDAQPIRRRVRSVVVGNCGELTGGLRLLPDAQIDDGYLDLVLVSPRWIGGWGTVFLSVFAGRRVPPRPGNASNPGVVEHLRCRSVEIRAERPVAVQIDGDAAGEARTLRATLDPGGLTVRTPRLALPR